MSSGIMPRSRLYSDKDAYREAYHSERVWKGAKVKDWDYLASELERRAEEVVTNRTWDREDEMDTPLEDRDAYNPIDFCYHPSQDVEIPTNKIAQIKWGPITLKGNLTRLL